MSTPLQGFPIPADADAIAGPAQLLALGAAIEKQVVMVFTTSTARDAAITAPVTGMHAWLSTPKLLTFYDGTAWRSVPDATSADTDLSFDPSGNLDATTSGTLTDWLTLGNITVPTWATRAFVTTSIMGVQEITAGGNTYVLRTTIGAALGALGGAKFLLATTGTGNPYCITCIDRISGLSSGSQSVKIQAARDAGTGQWRLPSTASLATAIVHFAP